MIIHARNNPYNKIDKNSILWIYDVFTEHDLYTWLNGQTPLYIVNDHCSAVNIPGQTIYCAPLWLAREMRDVVKNFNKTLLYQTKNTFNFMINKKQINRFLCIKLVEMFKLKNYDYTWSGLGNRVDMSEIINELNLIENKHLMSDAERSFLLSDVRIAPKFFQGTVKNVIHDVSVSYTSNSDTWNSFLHNLFSSSAISLITESLTFQTSTVFTEKTAYSVLGKTFPIWVGGGVQQADRFKDMGFDVFDDVIDHSYQHCKTLIERCYYAFKNNLHILTNFEYARKMRENHMSRLDKNLQLMQSNQIDNFCKQQISQWPQDLQNAIDNEINKWI